MSDQENAASEAVVVEAPETKVVGKAKKVTTTGNLIADIASEIESLKKDKALALADKLYEEGEVSNFKLGGVLTVIRDNTWFEGYESFDAYVSEKFGMKERKARYLTKIYSELVTKQIPWEKVSVLGWTKLKDLVELLTLENVDEWVAKALPLTYKELMLLIKGAAPEGGEGTSKTTDGIVNLKFKLQPDQAETVQSALSKAKAEVGTEFDTVALETICGGYLGGVIAVEKPQKTVQQLMTEMGWEAALQAYSDLYPEVDIEVKVAAA